MGTFDLYLAAAVLLALAVALFVGGYALARSRLTVLPECAIIVVIASIVVFTVWVQDQPVLVRVVPWSGAILLTRISLPLAGLLAGLIAGRATIAPWRRGVLVVALAAAGVYSAAWPMRGSTPPTSIAWRDGVCLQTSPSTCGPAAGATLLATVDIEATEAELTALSLTRTTGTTYLGMWRGLTLKTRGTPWRPQAITGDVENLRREDRPVMIWLVLDEDRLDEVDPRYVTQWGWQPGVAHSVVLFGFTPEGRPIIGDPAVGLEVWSIEGLRTLYMGEGVRLVKR